MISDRLPDSGGGAMWDIGIHVTDMVRHILGEVTSINHNVFFEL